MWLVGATLAALSCVVAAVNVLELTDETLAPAIELFSPLFLLVYVSWDPNATAVQDAFAALASDPTTPTALTFAQLDVATHKHTTIAVLGFPTYLYFADGFNNVTKFDGVPTPVAFQSWHTRASPLVEIDNVDTFFASVDDTAFFAAVAVLPTLHGPERLAVELLARQDTGHDALAIIDVATWSPGTDPMTFPPQLWLYDTTLHVRTLYPRDQPWTADAMQTFLNTHRQPWIRPFDATKPLDTRVPAYALLLTDGVDALYQHAFMQVALEVAQKSTPTQFLLVESPGVLMESFLGVTSPAVVWYYDQATFVPFSSSGSVLAAALQSSPRDVVAKLLLFRLQQERRVRAREAEIAMAASARRLVEDAAADMEATVMDITSIVMLRALVARETQAAVVFYSPRCPSCQALVPMLAQLADQVPALAVAKLNVDTMEYKDLVHVMGGSFSLPSIYVVGGGVQRIDDEDTLAEASSGNVRKLGDEAPTLDNLKTFCLAAAGPARPLPPAAGSIHFDFDRLFAGAMADGVDHCRSTTSTIILRVLTLPDVVRTIVEFQDGIFDDLRPYFATTRRSSSSSVRGYYPTNPTVAVLHLAIARNDMHVVRRLSGCRPAMFTPQAVDLAAAFGHVTLLDACLCGLSATTSAMDSAAQNGHLAMVTYLHVHRTEGCTPYALNAAIRENHIDVAAFLLDHRHEGCTDNMVDHAAAAGLVEMVQLLHAHSVKGFSAQTLDMAAAGGHLSVVDFLVTHRASDGCSVDALNDAARRGHVDVVAYLHRCGKPCTTDAMDDAAANGHFEIVAFLHDHRNEGCTTDAIDLASRNGHLEVVQFLHARRTEGCTVDALNDAAYYGHRQLVHFLMRHYVSSCDVARATTLARRAGHEAIAAALEACHVTA
ncbi:Aste57867_8088 [Aphanomyces stellatus]|uniref:Aste57867_8088 protein n=1 Tax=Aphanomyces stellatus TaxID=120398 RepID=A0A485KJC1_9STRA|nr:hypothetical protein As57867_008058 [Aphanomyces stellatus]VFT84977.1 Aste57867_8088 [Aphanomyces stellatus]